MEECPHWGINAVSVCSNIWRTYCRIVPPSKDQAEHTN
jgi:hypothetical protein